MYYHNKKFNTSFIENKTKIFRVSCARNFLMQYLGKTCELDRECEKSFE